MIFVDLEKKYLFCFQWILNELWTIVYKQYTTIIMYIVYIGTIGMPRHLKR